MTLVATPSAGVTGLRAPRDHGTAVVAPPLAVAGQLVDSNRRILASDDSSLLGHRCSDIARQARHEVHQSAVKFTTAYRDIPADWRDAKQRPILMAGHQPELFHPGVWFKNFGLATLADAHDVIGIHLLIDNDVCQSAAVTAVSGSPEDPRITPVPLDAAYRLVPFEERPLVDAAAFQTFGDRIEQTTAGIIRRRPLARALWRDAREAAARQRNLGMAVSELRHRLEGTWGLATLELPLSVVSDTHAFRLFLLHILNELSRFRSIYNDALTSYRRQRRMRSRSHPVPQLARVDDWEEAPFWIWSTDAPQRQPLLVRRRGDQLQLRGGKGGRETVRLNLSAPNRDGGERALAELADAREQGIKLRPRALMTTLFARLFLCDLFLHGIGGATYDQLTDILWERFLGGNPTSYMALSATFRLPIPHIPVDQDDVRQVDGVLREMWYHPDRHADAGRGGGAGEPEAVTDEVSRLVSRKQQLIAAPPPRGQRRHWHRELEGINAQLRQQLTQTREKLLAERARLLRDLRKSAIVSSRDYSFCLFPEQTLRPRLLDLCRADFYA